MTIGRGFAASRAGIAAAVLACAGVPAGAASTLEPDVPYVPTPPAVVDAMLGLAQVGPRDFVLDLGSGDGRVVIAAAKRYGARGTGVEIDSDLVSAARLEAARQDVAGRVTFIEDNLFVTDIGRASVLTMYLSTTVLAQLRQRLIGELKPGTRIVSHDFEIEGWAPDGHVTVPVPQKAYGPPRSEVYLWVVPANAAGTWRWRGAIGGAPVDYELALTQTFQMLEGRAAVGGAAGRIEGGRMRGAAIRFALDAAVNGHTHRHEFSGRVEGDAIRGKVAVAGAEHDWRATRIRRGVIALTGEQ